MDVTNFDPIGRREVDENFPRYECAKTSFYCRYEESGFNDMSNSVPIMSYQKD